MKGKPANGVLTVALLSVVSAAVCGVTMLFSNAIMSINSAFGGSIVRILLIPVVFTLIYFADRAYSEKMRPAASPDGDFVCFRLLSLLFCLLSHSVGASVGKEGIGVETGIAFAFAMFLAFRKIGLSAAGDGRLFVPVAAGTAFGTLFCAPLSGLWFGLRELEFPEETDVKGEAVDRLKIFIPLFAGSALIAFLRPHSIAIALSGTIPVVPDSLIRVFFASVCAALLARAFFLLSKSIETLCRRRGFIVRFVFSALISALVFLYYRISGSLKVAGLSSGMVAEAFAGDADYLSFAFKFLLTAVSLSVGFKGGCIVPFVIFGAMLGSFFAPVSAQAAPFAAVGVCAVFSAASGRPVLATLLCSELFSFALLPWYAGVALLSYFLSGAEHIYAMGDLPLPALEAIIRKKAFDGAVN